jgi:hypothetical protein
MIDHKLTKNKVSKHINATYKSKSIPPKYRKVSANAIVLPVFDYLDIIYSGAFKRNRSDLDIFYKNVAKIALDVPTSESSLSVYKDIRWLNFHLRQQLHLSCYMFGIFKGNCPTNFEGKLSYISGGSRNANNCNLHISNPEVIRNFFFLGFMLE